MLSVTETQQGAQSLLLHILICDLEICHTFDMFDMKPDVPSNVRGEFSPIETAVPGTQICELLPQIAMLMDRATLIRTYSHRYNSEA